MKEENEGIKINKKGNEYVVNAVFTQEIIKSKEQDLLTSKALEMLMVMEKNILKILKWNRPEDKDDCFQSAMEDVLRYWRSFNPEKKNAFAYFTSMLQNGTTKGWNKIYKIKPSEMTSLDNNIHTI